MLLSHEYAIITIDDANTIKKFIEDKTATPSQLINYKKIGEMNMLPIYHMLNNFIHAHGRIVDTIHGDHND